MLKSVKFNAKIMSLKRILSRKIFFRAFWWGKFPLNYYFGVTRSLTIWLILQRIKCILKYEFEKCVITLRIYIVRECGVRSHNRFFSDTLGGTLGFPPK